MPECVYVSKVRACTVADVEFAAACLWIIDCNEGGQLLWMEAAATELQWYGVMEG